MQWDAEIARSLREHASDPKPSQASLEEVVAAYVDRLAGLPDGWLVDPKSLPADAKFEVEFKVIDPMSADTSDDDPTFWVVEVVNDLVHRLPSDDVVHLLALLIEAAPDDDVLGVVAAGPLEDFIVERGQAAVDAIRPLCSGSPRVRLALSGVWLDPGPLEDEVQELAGPDNEL